MLGEAPTRFESATNSVSAAKASPLAPPRIVSLELESWEVKVDCPITSRAACPVVKSAAHTAAAENKNMEMHFMRNVLDLNLWILNLQL